MANDKEKDQEQEPEDLWDPDLVSEDGDTTVFELDNEPLAFNWLWLTSRINKETDESSPEEVSEPAR